MLDKRLLGIIKGKGKLVVGITVLNIASLLCSVTITATMCLMLHSLIYGTYSYPMWAYIVIIAVSAIAKFLLSTASSTLRNNLGSYVKSTLRTQLVDKTLSNPHNNMGLAEVTQMSIEGIEQLDLYFSMFLPHFFYAMISPLILFVLCVVLEYKTALVLLLCIPLIPMSIVLVSRYAKKIFAKYWGKYTAMGDIFLDSLKGLKDLKVYNSDQAKHQQINDSSEEFRRITMKVLIMQLASVTIMDLIAFGGAGIAIVMTIISAVNGQISPMVALFLVLISAEFFLPMRALGSAFHISMNGATAGNKILDYLESPSPTKGTTAIDSIDSITLDGVTFGYTDDCDVLHNIDMTLTKGINSIVGESGCGKSTIASLVLGTNHTNSGRVAINNTDIADISTASLYSHMALVSYNTHIFNKSIRDNFLLANSNASDQQIEQALEQVNLLQFVSEIGGLDYTILEGSENISGGQRQRLALAINIVANKQLYVLDEATSNIDSDSEAIIMDTIASLAQDKIILLISHRLQNVVNSTNIFMLDAGTVAEQGNHTKLMANNSSYCALYNAQQKLELGYTGGAQCKEVN